MRKIKAQIGCDFAQAARRNFNRCLYKIISIVSLSMFSNLKAPSIIVQTSWYLILSGTPKAGFLETSLRICSVMIHITDAHE